MNRKQKVNNILFLIGVVSVVVMFLATDLSLEQLKNSIVTAGYWLPCAILLWALLYALNAVAWQTIIQSDGEVKWDSGIL